MIFNFKVGMPAAVVNPHALFRRFHQLCDVALDRVPWFDKYTGKRKLRPRGCCTSSHHTTRKGNHVLPLQ